MRHASLALALGTSIAISACVSVRPWRLDEPPLVAADVDRAEELRVLTRDGQRIELRAVRWIEDPDGARLAGIVVAPAERAGQAVEIAVDELQGAETRRREMTRVLINVGIGLGIAFVVVAGLVYVVGASGGFMP